MRQDLLHADETELQVLHEYQPGRRQEYPKKFPEGFRGYLQADGYAGYNGLNNVRRVGCWAHARRGFDEAAKVVPKGKRSPTAEQGLAYCTKLFKLDEEFKDLRSEEQKERRQERSKPLLDVILAWANTRAAAPKLNPPPRVAHRDRSNCAG